ncbi:hypothetical protein [Neogemmobacter tilapiae]|uniref:Acetyltransferase n=1 Tax=Neogemmobacter tilapiae TaxID=875041 RepID=A0A918WGE5_9RHOB|nr:hypothetical protein [Gemmobacter tilapiae]GHC45234.1 acetyltransferase [Gemmobacter tilapiae]
MENLRECFDPAEWAALCAASPDQPMAQSWDYGQAMAVLGARVRRFVFGETIAQVLERPGLRLVNRGPLGPRAGPMLRRLARHWGVTLATPEHALPGWGRMPLITPRHQAIWRLDPDADAMRGNLSAKWRNRLLRAEERGLRITHGQVASLNELLTAEAIQRQQRGYRALPGAFAIHWPGEKLLLEWREGGQMQAGMLFLRHGAWASYHIGWASDRGRAVFAHGPMLWKAARILSDQGISTLDLGTVDSANPGLAHFKLGTGAELRALGPTVWAVW